MARITLCDLENKIKYLNQITKNEVVDFNSNLDGLIMKWNVGTYTLDRAYGGHKLIQITNSGGGCRDVLRTGFTTKRNLYNNIDSYIRGIEDEE